MTRKLGIRTLCALLATTLLSSLAARGQFPGPPHHFAGLINDYTPTSVANGPYVMAGKWSLEIHHGGFGRPDTAEFSAYMNMETSDYGILEGIVTPTDATTRGAHTHDITMTGSVTYDSPDCPANPTGTPPASGGNILVTGNVSVTGNGTPAPFETKGASTLQVCITGGTLVPLTNLTMTFVGPATGHFGTQPIHGVVKK